MRKFAGYVVLVLAAFQLGVLVAAAVGNAEALASPGGALLVVLGLVVEGLVMYATVRIARRLIEPEPMPERVEPRAGLPPPIGPVDPAALADVPEPVSACPDCGFLGVRMPGIRDGLWPGGGELGDRIVCPRCGFQGLAVRFERREEYGAFLRELAGAPA